MAKQLAVRVSAYLTTDQYEALRREAFERRSKITVLVREAISFWLQAQKKEGK